MSLFENFPYTNLHELNIDWLINELKMVKESAVISVNGQTGEVILYEDADIEFPATDNGGWDIIRKVDGTVNAGIRFTGDGVAYIITGSRVRQMYDADHQPPYPVTSVNGETGAVTITPPVSSVNGQTGEVILYQEQYVQLPDLTGEQLQNWNFYRRINNILHGIQFDTDGRAYIMNGAGRYQIYTEHNAQPFTFVDDVNAGVMEISQAAPAGVWGLLRETDSGTAGIVFSYDSTTPTAYLRYITGSGEQAVTHNVKLLTPDDIPASAGVVSINGLAGVVVITGTDINYKTGSTLKIGSMIDSILESVGDLTNLTTTDKTSLVNAVNELVSAIGTVNTNITNLGTRISNAESTVGIVQTGATATQNISAGQYVIWNDALYKASTNISSGDTFNGTNLDVISNGIANELNSKIAIEDNSWTNIKTRTSTGTETVDLSSWKYVALYMTSINGYPTDTKIIPVSLLNNQLTFVLLSFVAADGTYGCRATVKLSKTSFKVEDYFAGSSAGTCTIRLDGIK